MKNASLKQLLIPAAIVWSLAIPIRLARAQAPAPQAQPLDALVLAWDKGPDKIDVSKYPADVKKNYKVFAELCGTCHSLARAVNCDFVLDDDWERYIKRMMRRGRSLITPAQAEQAFEFATYDSKIRKKDLYDRQMKLAGRK
jgi:cytochrome c5